MTELTPKYNPTLTEHGRYEKWLAQGVFKPSGDKKAHPYSIVIPPPNVTGKLHLGHAWDTTLQDIIIRQKRMQGFDTLWLPGMDHAGIATQAKVEARLAEDGISRYDLGREKFLDKVWKWKDEYATTIKEQWGKMGISVDYDRERFTLDEGLSKAVRKVFVDLYKKGWIYRGEFIINWDPKARTALSDIEVIHKDVEGAFYHIAYPLSDGSGVTLEIATTRPETMFGDTALAVNPADPRYNQYIGKSAILPLVGKVIPIIGDAHADMEKGTGVVKITPAHDPNDFEVGNRHNLPRVNVMNADGTMNELAGEFAGMDRFDCRKAVAEKLDEIGALVSVEKIVHAVGHSERTGVEIEPRLSTQWFVKMAELAKQSINNQATADAVVFYPSRFNDAFLQWMANVHDWVISRQLWWGHQIPAWYDAKGNIYVAEDENEAKEQFEKYLRQDFEAYYKETLEDAESKNTEDYLRWKSSTNDLRQKGLKQDEDVLDTWFSSALWPFSTMGWPDKDSADFKRYYPTSTLVTGYDILPFWVARMIFQGIEFTGQSPFRNALIHGLIRDEEGRKMSKSLGNGIDPMDVIEKYGADALRWFLSNGSAPGQDIRFSYTKMDAAWNFINKIWNVSRYILMNSSELTADDVEKNLAKVARGKVGATVTRRFSDVASIDSVANEVSGDRSETADAPIGGGNVTDRWILTRLNDTITRVTEQFDKFEFGVAGHILYNFIWDEFANWYIELTKEVLYGENEAEKVVTRSVLVYILEQILKLLHPIMPFVTEEIFEKMPQVSGSIVVAAWPKVRPAFDDVEAAEGVTLLIELITAVRNIRAEVGTPLSKPIEILVRSDKADFLKSVSSYITRFANPSALTISTDFVVPEQAMSAVITGAEIYLPLAGLINIDEEIARLSKELDKWQKELDLVNRKLSNEKFTANAKPEVVEKERAKLKDYEEKYQSTQLRIDELKK